MYLFVLVLEIFFIFVENNPKVKGRNIFKHEFLYTAKCEIAGISVLNGVQAALCGMKCVNLSNETVKILGVHF